MRWIYYKRYLPIACIILLSGLFRFVYLDRIPNAMNGDELLYAITAKSVWLTGHDITGTWNPLSAFTFRSPPNETSAELPYFIQLPLSGPFPFSLLVAKLPFALLSIGIVLVIYGITKELFGAPAGLAAGLIASVNPWLVVTGRTGYESTPAAFFYLLALYILLTAKNQKILWSFVPFVLAFYSYIGTKLILIPFATLAAILAYLHHGKKYKTYYVALFLINVIFVLGFIYLLHTSANGSRISEVILPNSPLISASLSPFSFFTSNPYIVYIRIIAGKLFRIFSPSYLFVEGDQFFLPAKQSFFYYIDGFFLLIGLFFLFIKKRLFVIIICLFALMGTFPHLFHKTMGDYSIHSTLMFPFLIMLIGAGIAEFVGRIPKRLKFIGTVILCCIYLFNVKNFRTVYLNQAPLVGYGDFPMRVLSRYLQIAKKQHMKIVVYSTRSGDFLKKYLFYTNTMTKQTMPIITHITTGSRFEYDGITFNSCDKGPVPNDTVAIYDALCDVQIQEPHIRIARLIDAGDLYQIVHDKVCSSYPLNRYPAGVTLNDFNINNLSERRFCILYVAK
jgi:4-amino-4-deoxy-L-arabinose transferase-like glycosyltransferase